MTLILVTREPGKIICYSDSRVTHRPNEFLRTVTDHFSKILVLPFRATTGMVGEASMSEARGEFGFAFAGDILSATALYSLASNIFSNIHDVKPNPVPKMSDFAESLARLANILQDDVIYDAKNRKYNVLLFGPCPQTKELKIFEVSVDESTIPFRYRSDEVDIKDTGLKLVGSGASSFLQHIKENPHKAATYPYAEILLDTIGSESDPTIGGNLQQCVATLDGVRIVPIIHPINDGENVDMHISGLSYKLVGNIGTFVVGREAIGFRVLDVAERLKNLPLLACSGRLGQFYKDPRRCRNSPPFPAFAMR